MGVQPPRHGVPGANRRVALVVSRFNEEISRELAAGAREALLDAGVDEKDIYEYEVPGAFELAPACRQVVAVGPEVDAVVAEKGGQRGVARETELLFRASPNERWLGAIEPSVAMTSLSGSRRTPNFLKYLAATSRFRLAMPVDWL